MLLSIVGLGGEVLPKSLAATFSGVCPKFFSRKAGSAQKSSFSRGFPMFCVCHLLFSLLFCFQFASACAFCPPGKLVFLADQVVKKKNTAFFPYLAFGFLSPCFESGCVFNVDVGIRIHYVII